MVEIRAARAEEKEEIKEFIDRIMKDEGIYDPNYGYADIEELEEAYGEENGVLYVAKDKGQIVGTIGVFGINGELSHLRRWYLDEGYRGKKIGKKLLDKALAYSEEAGYLGITGVTEHELKRAFGIYEKNGFRVFKSTEKFNYIVKPHQEDTEELEEALRPLARIDWDTAWCCGGWRVVQELKLVCCSCCR